MRRRAFFFAERAWEYARLRRGTHGRLNPPEGYVPQIRLAPEAPPEGEVDDGFWLDVREHVGA